MTYESSSAASDVSLAPFGLRIIRAMQPSAAGGETAECVAKHSQPADAGGHLPRRQSDRPLQRRMSVEAIVSCAVLVAESRTRETA